MTPAVLDIPRVGPLESPAGEPRMGRAPVTPREGDRGLTLEQRLQGTWCDARRDGTAECPVCHAAMWAEGAAASCGGCGSVLS